MEREADGYYYEAMADEQLGRVRQGMKAIEKALRIEPEAADLMAVKGQLLVGMNRNEAAAQWFHKACGRRAGMMTICFLKEGPGC